MADFELPFPEGNSIPWPGIDEKHLSFTFISLLLDNFSVSLRALVIHLWNRRYPENSWNDCHRDQVDSFLYGVDAQFTVDIANSHDVKLSSGNILECREGFSKEAIYGCNSKGGFRGYRIIINGVFHWVEKISVDMKKIHLETSPTIHPEGHNNILGRNDIMFRSNSNGSLNKSAFLNSKSIDDWDITMLFFMIRNSGHALLNSEELAETLTPARNARNKYFGHLKRLQLSYQEFVDAVSSLLNFLVDTDRTFSLPSTGLSFSESFRVSIYRELFSTTFNNEEMQEKLVFIENAVKMQLDETTGNFERGKNE